MRTNEEQARLEREIQDQRQHISEIVQALENKLSPGQMFERVLHSSKDAGGEFARNLGHTVKANPVPSVLTAAGLLWLYAGKDRSAAQSVRVTHGDALHSGSGVGVGERLSGKWGEVRHRAGDTAHGAREAIAQRAHQAGDGLRHMLDDNPLAVGAMAVAAGALLGAMLPRTEAENRLMGEASDEMTSKAKALRDKALDEAERADWQATRQVAQPAAGEHPPGGFAREQHDEGDEMSSGEYRGTGVGPGVGQPLPRPGASPNPY